MHLGKKKVRWIVLLSVIVGICGVLTWQIVKTQTSDTKKKTEIVQNVSSSPNTETTPDTSVQPGVSITPDVTGTPDVSNTPDISATPDASETPDVSNTPEVSASPNKQKPVKTKNKQTASAKPSVRPANGVVKPSPTKGEQGVASSQPLPSVKPSEEADKTTKPTVNPTTGSTTKPSTVPSTGPSEKQCTITIVCKDILSHKDWLKEGVEAQVPTNGVILGKTTVLIQANDTAFSILKRVCSSNNIKMDSVYTPMFDSYYIQGINGIFEFDCGDTGGWMFRVNGENPTAGCSQYAVSNGDAIEFYYSCEPTID